MTTKLKIIIGFALMMLIIVVIGVLGYSSAQTSSKGFDEYQELSQLSLAAGTMSTDLSQAVGAVANFMMDKSPESIATSRAELAASMKELADARAHTTDNAILSSLSVLEGKFKEIGGIIDAVEKNLLATDAHFMDVVLVRGGELLEHFKLFTRASQRASDVEGLVFITDALNELAAARASIARYAAGRMKDDAVASRMNFDAMSLALGKLESNVVSERGKAMMAELKNAFAAYISAFEELTVKTDILIATLNRLHSVQQESLAMTEAFNQSSTTEMLKVGGQMHDSFASVATQTLVIGGIGIVLGLAVALFIVFGLIKTLKALSEFAIRVSRGNFNGPVGVREGGEIGAMVKAMQAIPTVLVRVMEEAKAMSHNILIGSFRTRMDPHAFEGEFSALAATFNTVGEAYTDVLDLIPLPIKSADPSKHITFLNKAAQDAVGGNFINEACANHIKSGVCNTQDCFGENCMKRNGEFSGETYIKPQDAHLDVSVTAIPLHDEQGAIAGYIELLTDITEIKDKQNTIIRIANQASEIADRVAAASEEIAAQVEQISRGTETQRSRIESTATAMSQMNSTVMEVARSAGHAAEQSDTTRNRAESGSDIVRQVVTSVQEVNTVALTMQKNMEELGGQAQSIGSVMGVISDIADQTNLLALNAAIEAARAGDAGRGFAVVADEVRKLAEKTMQATQEVGSSILSIQQSTTKNIEVMEGVAQGVGTATKLATSSGEALGEIVALAAENSSIVASIAAAAEEQSATSEEINRSIEEINHVVAETADAMTQSSSAVQELSSMTQNLRSIIDSLR